LTARTVIKDIIYESL